MMRNALIAFIIGWIIWFWIEKPRAGLAQFLQADESILVNFQRSFDLLKSGYLVQSYIYIWNAHYIVLSLIFGVILKILYGFISDYLVHKRTRSRVIRPASIKQKQQRRIETSEDKE